MIASMWLIGYKSFNDFMKKVTSDEQNSLQIIILFTAILMSALVHELAQKYSWFISYDPIVLLFAFIVGVIAVHTESTKTFCNITKTHAFQIFYYPAVFFQSGFALDTRAHLKFLVPILIFSFPMALMSATMIGFFVIHLCGVEYNWRVNLVAGLMLVTVKPSTVIKHLKLVGSNTKYTRVLLEGEAATVVIILMTVLFLNRDFEGFKKLYGLGIPLEFVMGYVFGKFGTLIIRTLYRNPITLTNMILPLPFIAAFISFTAVKDYTITTFIMGIVMGKESSTSLTIETNKFIRAVWSTLLHILHCINYMIIGMVCASEAFDILPQYSYMYVVPCFLIVIFVRIFIFVLFSPVIRWLQQGITYEHLIICAISNVKHPVPLALVYRKLVTSLNCDDTTARYLCMLYTSTFFLSSIIISPLVPMILRITGLTKTSFGAQINLENCMKFISERRANTISILKLNRFLADVDWKIVLSTTELKRPWSHQARTSAAENKLDNTGYYETRTVCPDCTKELFYVPTQKEFNEMIKEASLRILKAQKVSFFRQYENGTLSKVGLYYLLQLAEFASNSDNPLIGTQEIEKLFEKEGWVNKFCRDTLFKYYRSINISKPQIPRRPFRKICHMIVSSVVYETFVLVMVLTNLAINLYELITPNSECSRYNIALIFFHSLIVLFFSTEVFLRIMAYSFVDIWEDGVRTYFNTAWYRYDFGTMCILVLGYFVYVAELGSGSCSPMLHYISRVLQLIETLRLFRLAEVSRPFLPGMISYFNWRIDEKLSSAYDIGKAYVCARIEVIEILPQLIENMQLRNQVRKTLEQGKMEITKLLVTVQNDRPGIAITVKTKQTVQTVLKSMKDSINGLKSAGWLDDFEYEVLTTAVIEKKKTSSNIKKVSPSLPEHILKEVAWIYRSGDKIYNLFLDNAQTKSYKPGETVIDRSMPEGILVVLTGLLRLEFKPDFEITFHLMNQGLLPCVDCCPNIMDYSEDFEDYIVSGDSVGCLSFVTQRPNDCIVTAESNALVNLLPKSCLDKAADIDPDPIGGFVSSIWRDIGIRIALPILMDSLPYRSMTKENIQMILEQAFVPELTYFKTVVVASGIEDLVLIYGTIIDDTTREVYRAPCYIPRTVQKIRLPQREDMETKLLIIPVKDMNNYALMDEMQILSEMKKTVSYEAFHAISQQFSNVFSPVTSHTMTVSIAADSSMNESKFSPTQSLLTRDTDIDNNKELH